MALGVSHSPAISSRLRANQKSSSKSNNAAQDEKSAILKLLDSGKQEEFLSCFAKIVGDKNELGIFVRDVQDLKGAAETVAIFFQSLFFPESDGLSPAFRFLLKPDSDENVVLALYYLCKRFSNLLYENPNKGHSPISLEGCQKALLDETNSFKEYFKAAKQTHHILGWIREFYTLHENGQKRVEPEDVKIEPKPIAELLSLLNTKANELNDISSLVEGESALDPQKLSSDYKAMAAYNGVTNQGVFSNVVVGYQPSPGSSPSMAQNEEVLGFNGALSVGAGILNAYCRSRARAPSEGLQRRKILAIKSLFKFYKKESILPRLTPEFRKKVEDEHDKLGEQQPDQDKLNKQDPKWFFEKWWSESPSPQMVLGHEDDIKAKEAVEQQEPTVYLMDFDYQETLKTGLLALKKALKAKENLSEAVSAFKNTFDELEKKLSKKMEQDLAQVREKLCTLLSTVFKQNQVRGTLLQHLLKLFKEEKSLQTQAILKELVQFILEKYSIEAFEDAYAQNKDLISKTNWQDRIAACGAAQQMALNILNNTGLSQSDKVIFLESIVENLKTHEKGSMAGVRVRRDKKAVEAGLCIASLQGQNLKRAAPLIGVATSSAGGVWAAAGGWGASSSFAPLATYFSEGDTKTFQLLLSSFEGALLYAQGLEQSEDPNENILKNALTKINEILINEEEKARAEEIVSTLTELKHNKGSSYLSMALEYAHGRKIPLLFELMDKLPQDSLKQIFKLYFSKEKNTDYNYDSFNKILSLGIKATKSPKEAALVTIKAMSYLLSFHEEIEKLKDDLEMLEQDSEESLDLQDKIIKKQKTYELCRKKLDTTLENAYDEKHSEFRILSRHSKMSRFLSEWRVRALGAVSWGLVSASVVSALTAATGLGIGIGIGISLTGIGLPLGLSLLAIAAAIRMVMSAYSEDPDRAHSRRTKTYRRVKDDFAKLIPKYEELNPSQSRFVDELANQNAEMRAEFEAVFQGRGGLQLHELLTKQMINLFGVDVDAGKIAHSPEELDAFTQDILNQSFDKASLLESLFRIVRLTVSSNLKFVDKVKRLLALYQDLLDGRQGMDTQFSKLSFENSFARTKNWYVFHAILGAFTSLGTILGLEFGATDLLQTIAQAALATAGDMTAAQSNKSVFHAPLGSTASFQNASLLIKNALIALAIEHQKELENNAELKAELEKILDEKTGRVNRWTRWDFIQGNTRSFEIYQRIRTVVVQ
jgi:hypothetical protein